MISLGYYSNKSSKLVLLSSSASLSFDAFATNEAIQCTEIYEYARQLANADYVIPSFQSYKFLYATRLAEHGRCAEALQYCEAVGSILAKADASQSSYPLSMMNQVVQLGSMLKFSDPQLLTEADPSQVTDPAWLTALLAVTQSNQPDLNEPVDNSASSSSSSFKQPSMVIVFSMFSI